MYDCLIYDIHPKCEEYYLSYNIWGPDIAASNSRLDM